MKPMKKYFTFYRFELKKENNSKPEHNIYELEKEFSDVSKFLKRYKFSPQQKTIDKILDYAKKS